MKTFTKIFTAVVAGMLAFSCVTDTTEDLGVNLGEGQSTTISIALDDESRTYIDEKNGEEYPMYWSEGDKIAVNGHTSLALTAEDINGSSAKFTIPAVLEGDYCVTYPAADKGQVKFAAEQTHKDNTTFGDGVTTMYGYGNGSNLTLKSLTGILKIGVTGSATLKMAQISTIDRAPIAGAFDFDFEKGEIVKAAADAKDVITYSFGEGVQLSDKPTYMHIAVPAGVYDELYVTLYDNEGGVMYATVKAYKNETENKSLKAGKVRVFTTPIAYTPNDSVFVIHDYESLCTFASKIGTLDKNAVFVNDIEIPEGETWKTIDYYNYKKTIYGHGYAIKGLTTPLFDRVGATIEGLHLEDVNIVETSDPEVGAFARYSVGAIWKNCSASGKITINNTTFNTASTKKYNQVLAGGMIGKSQGGSFENCTNNVDLEITSLSDPTVAHYMAVGGFVGMVWNGVSLENIVNNGTVSYKPASQHTGPIFIGGIVGKEYANTAFAKLKKCENYGDITVVSNSTGNMYVAGVTGMITAVYSVDATDHTIFDDLKNHGAINISGKAKGLMVGGVTSYQVYPFHLGAENSGNITIGGTYTGEITVGGVHRYITTSTVEVEGENLTTQLLFKNLKNSGNITIQDGTSAGGILQIGGVCFKIVPDNRSAYLMSHFADFENNGAITVNSASTTSLAVGGLWASSNIGFTIKNCHNRAKGTISIIGATSTGDCMVGGVAAYQSVVAYGNNKMEFSDCSNSATITVKPTSATTVRVGGVIGYADTKRIANSRSFTRVHNYGDIIVGGGTYSATKESYSGYLVAASNSSNCSATYNGNAVGGIIGMHYDYGTFNTCNNEGDITINYTGSASHFSVGGIIGRHLHHTTDKTTSFTSCNNCGDINYAPAKVTGSSRLGGIIGKAESEKGTKESDGTEITPYEIITMSQCNNSGGFTIEPTNSEGGIYTGGLIGVATTLSHCTIQNCSSNNNSEGVGFLFSKKVGGTAYCGLIGLIEFKGVDKTSTVSGCSNNSDIKFTETAQHSSIVASHIIGRNTETPASGTKLNIDGCSVSGDFDFLGTCTGLFYYAGYYAYPHDTTITTTISNCTKAGAVKVGGSIGGRAVIGGYVGYWRSKVNFDTVSNSGAINFHGTMTCEDSLLAIGGIGAQTNNSQTPTMKAVTNTGDITVTGNIGKNTLFVGGINGTEYDGSARVIKFENAVNSGNFYLGTEETTLTTGKAVYVGGISARVQAANTTFTAPILNTGNITITNATIGDIANSYIGGLVGLTAAKIDGAKNFCNIEAIGYSGMKIGMITGSARVAATPLVNNCAVGGKICTSMTGEGEAERPNEIVLSAGNYYNYIYGSADWTGVEGYDGCEYISAIDAEPAN